MESNANFYESSSILWIFHMFSWRKHGEVSSSLILIVQFSQKFSLRKCDQIPHIFIHFVIFQKIKAFYTIGFSWNQIVGRNFYVY